MTVGQLQELVNPLKSFWNLEKWLLNDCNWELMRMVWFWQMLWTWRKSIPKWYQNCTRISNLIQKVRKVIFWDLWSGLCWKNRVFWWGLCIPIQPRSEMPKYLVEEFHFWNVDVTTRDSAHAVLLFWCEKELPIKNLSVQNNRLF